MSSCYYLSIVEINKQTKKVSRLFFSFRVIVRLLFQVTMNDGHIVLAKTNI